MLAVALQDPVVAQGDDEGVVVTPAVALQDPVVSQGDGEVRFAKAVATP